MLSHSLSLSLPFALSLPRARALSLFLSRTRARALSLSLSLSLSLVLSLALSLSLSGLSGRILQRFPDANVVCVSHGDAVAAFMVHTGFTTSKDNVYEVSLALPLALASLSLSLASLSLASLSLSLSISLARVHPTLLPDLRLFPLQSLPIYACNDALTVPWCRPHTARTPRQLRCVARGRPGTLTLLSASWRISPFCCPGRRIAPQDRNGRRGREQETRRRSLEMCCGYFFGFASGARFIRRACILLLIFLGQTGQTGPSAPG